MKTAIDTIREAFDAAIPVSNIAYNLGQSHESRESNLKCVAKFDELRRAALTSLKSLEGQGWVSTDDRLPDFGVKVLVFQKYDTEPYIASRRMEKSDITKGYWYADMADAAEIQGDGSYDGFVGEAYCNITHWQPLPSAPALTKSANP